MYEIWSPAENYTGRTLILISFRSQALSDQALAGSAPTLGPIQERQVSKLGIPAGRYYYRLADAYHPS
jgi:hypothetical protein